MWAFRSRAVAFVLSVLVAAQAVAPAAAAAAEAVTIPAGTPVMLAFQEAVRPLTAQVGQKILLRTTSPVVIDGKTVIAEGAIANGEVTSAQKKGAVGKPAIIGVMLRTVEAVDGTLVPVSGTKVVEGENQQTTALVVTILCCILGLLMQGGDAEIAAGSSLDGRTDIATTVQVTVE